MTGHGGGRRYGSLRSAAVLALALMAAAPAVAAEGEGCDAAAWSLAADGGRLSHVSTPQLSGGTLALAAPTALVLKLAPTAEARLPFPPGRPPAPETFAGTVSLQLPPGGGIVQVTLAQAAWIDLIREGEALSPVAFTGVRNCPLARKSVRFRVPAGTWSLQLSGAATSSLALAVSLDP